MKKFKLLLCTIFACTMFIGLSAEAKSGDVVGKVYSTNIIAKIDGRNAPSYNIGGRTAIVAEELCDNELGLYYGVNAKYDDTARRLDVEIYPTYEYSGDKYDVITRGTVGKTLGNVYETDIKVYVNGFEITGYNIGGKTAIAIEDLGFIDGYNSEYGYSKYRLRANWDEENRIISLFSIGEKEFSPYTYSNFEYGSFIEYTIQDDVMTAKFDRMISSNGELETNIENISQELKNTKNILRPLYFDDGNKKHEIGFMYLEEDEEGNNAFYIPYYYVTNQILFADLLEALYDGKKPTAEEAFEFLNDGVNYKILDKFETEDFYVVTVKHLAAEGEYDELSFVLVGKNGGYGKIYGKSSFYREWKIEKVGENIVNIAYGPTAGPSGGMLMMNCEFNLNNYTAIK